MTEEAPRIEVTISASIDEVWRALRDPVLISRWHGWHYEGLDDEVRVISSTARRRTSTTTCSP